MRRFACIVGGNITIKEIIKLNIIPEMLFSVLPEKKVNGLWDTSNN